MKLSNKWIAGNTIDQARDGPRVRSTWRVVNVHWRASRVGP